MAETEKKLTLILFSGEQDKAIACLNLAIGAAAADMEVSIFFTFWGLNVIKKEEGPIRSPGLMRKMLNFMNRGGAKRLGMSKFHMWGLGKWMFGKLMADARLPTVREQLALAREMGVRFIACTTSIGIMGISKDAFIPEVDTFAGVATYLAEAQESDINLFI